LYGLAESKRQVSQIKPAVYHITPEKGLAAAYLLWAEMLKPLFGH
jgi:hypothetical protein